MSEKSCKNCPSYLPADQTASKFRGSIGAPMCGRFGYVLGRPGLAPAGEEAICKAKAHSCPAYGQDLPSLPINRDHTVALVDPDIFTLKNSGNQPEMVTSCQACVHFIKEEDVLSELGWGTPMCGVKGTLMFRNNLVREAKDCDWRSHGTPNRSARDVHLMPEYEDAFVLTGNPNDVSVFLAQKRNQVDPREYPTDRELSPEDIKSGLRAWRRVHNPDDPDKFTFLPIYNLAHIPEHMQAWVPQTGDDEHPEDYADHMNLVFRVAVLWRELDETPALWGVAGTGKTEFFRYMAWLMQLPFIRMSITGSTELDDLAGKMHLRDGKTVFEYGRLPKAWICPCVIDLDEPNTGPDDVWQFIRPLIDNSKQLALDMNEGEILKRNDDCYLGFAMNPAWDVRNKGTHEISDADGRRLAHIEVQYPSEGIEREILRQRCAHDGYEVSDKMLRTIMAISRELRQLSGEEQTLQVTWGIAQNIKVARATAWFDLPMCYRMAAADYLEPDQREIILTTVRSHDLGVK